MSAAWTIRDREGQLLSEFVAGSRQDVARKVLPTRYDQFRLQVSASYRELFERAVMTVLQQRGWEIVRIGASAKRLMVRPDTCSASGLN